MSRQFFSGIVIIAALLTVPASGARKYFVPDWTFKGASIAAFQTVGQATWRAVDGEIIGTPNTSEGGWLILDKSFQDVEFGGDVRCTGGCKTGVLLRAEKTSTGMKGVYISLVEGEIGGYAVTLDAKGKELTRAPLRPGLGMMRIAPPASVVAAEAAARGANAAARPAGPPSRGRGVLPSGAVLPNVRTPAGWKANDWNDLDIVVDANMVRPFINTETTGGGAADEDLGRFGPIALYVGGTGEVRFREVSYRDLSLKRVTKEELSPNFRMQRLTPHYYSFSAAAADMDRDGNLDIVSGPFIFMGPDFVKAREFYMAQTINPSLDFTSNWVAFAGDFTGDGWPDVFVTTGSKLYVNPKGEARRWDVYSNVIPQGSIGEIAVMKDIDGDGKPDLVYAAGGAVRWARPDPANPTGPWLSTQVGEQGTYGAHGIGAGDINGDGRTDILNVYGWYEQPPKGQTGLWTYHPQPFGRGNGRGGEGGAEMCVFDANGDGLSDVVTVLQAHVFGLAWYEQKRDSGGAISFTQHMISDDFSAKNAGNVAFSEPHGSTCADMDKDGVPDFIVGKRYFSHKESYLDPDPYGPPVLYVYRTVRNKQAPGGAEFVPELVHNASGAGSQVLAIDLNKDGAVDLVTSGEVGAFAFFGKARGATQPKER